MTVTTFSELELDESLLNALESKGFTRPTAIQAAAIPPALEGRDVLGSAPTGTGKTAAYLLPVLQHLLDFPRKKSGPPRILILTPTRELAAQIDECCRDYARYTDIRHCVIFGGVNQRPQVDALQKGVDLLVATPGRLLDLIGQGYVTLDTIRFFVLQAHYRSTLDFSNEALQAAEKGLDRLMKGIETLGKIKPAEVSTVDPAELETRCAEAMDDDLNTPDALAAVFDLVKDINTLSAASSKAALEAGAAAFDEITGVLGLMYNRKKDEVPAEVTELVEKRAAAKKAKDWAAADAIRAQLTEMGWAVKDTAQGPQLSKI